MIVKRKKEPKGRFKAQVRTRKRGKKWSYAFEAGIVDGKPHRNYV
jgi:hypothetical protein